MGSPAGWIGTVVGALFLICVSFTAVWDNDVCLSDMRAPREWMREDARIITAKRTLFPPTHRCEYLLESGRVVGFVDRRGHVPFFLGASLPLLYGTSVAWHRVRKKRQFAVLAFALLVMTPPTVLALRTSRTCAEWRHRYAELLLAERMKNTPIIYTPETVDEIIGERPADCDPPAEHELEEIAS